MVLVIAGIALANGQLVSYTGYYTPPFIIGVSVAAVGAGLLTTLKVNASAGQWIGYQVIYGFGLGLASQAPNMAAQTVLSKQDIAIGASLMFFGYYLHFPKSTRTIPARTSRESEFVNNIGKLFSAQSLSPWDRTCCPIS